VIDLGPKTLWENSERRKNGKDHLIVRAKSRPGHDRQSGCTVRSQSRQRSIAAKLSEAEFIISFML
jgi:hypothetical protein